MTDPSSHVDTRQHRSFVPWLAVAIIAVVVAGGFFWINRDSGTKSETPAPQPQASVQPPPDPAVEQLKQTLSSLQQTVKDIQSGQQKLADEITDTRQKASTDQGERKMLSDQIGALSARVDALVATNAESPTPQPQAAPAQQKAKRTKR
jgi:hypothetical protein